MGKYLVKVLPTDECNKDFWPLKEMMDGIECDGFVCITQSGEKPDVSFLMNMSAELIERAMMDKHQKAGCLVRCAAVCADAQLRAIRELERADMHDQLEELLRNEKNSL